MNSTTPRTIQRRFAVATSADFLKDICETPSMIEATTTSVTPMRPSAIRVVRAAADEPHACQDEDDPCDLQKVDLLAEPGGGEPKHGDIAEGGDGLRVAQIRHLQHAQPVEELGEEQHHAESEDDGVELGGDGLPEELYDRVEHDREPEPEGERGGD